ncbi:hypothetical protein pmac_cds_797 [Pandoravirus macleodensis]|uniref:Uncharacterized protein n=1 Tax=Pandoravirus macleodensis TaxID=2107707 RepID=A0A2U7UGF6_9VIRU|nr:hypothetical protein pmac_cds_797 [Pandoravirus macleodensis]AVK77485.1 hypothetical protein pmac_cds_797 [Pandoravirus macleodensis]
MEDKSDISVPPEIETKVQEGVYEETVRQRESTADPKPFWHFSEHRKWGATPQGQRELAKYPQVKPRTEEEEAKHEAFGKRIFARYASN